MYVFAHVCLYSCHVWTCVSSVLASRHIADCSPSVTPSYQRAGVPTD